MRANIYPVPDPELPFLGAHLTRGPDGTVLLGPTALMVGARDAYKPWRLRRADLRETLAWPGTRRLIAKPLARWRPRDPARGVEARLCRAPPGGWSRSCEPHDFVAGPAGIRAQALAADGTLVDDFVVSRIGAAVFVRNAPSPAATSSMPLARLIADEAGDVLE